MDATPSIPLPPVTECRSCHAPVRWVLTPDGKRMILNAAPAYRWVVSQGADGKWHGLLVATFEPHWATCPDAKKWRGRG